MRYEKNTKIKRNQALYEFYLVHSELSLKEIGQIFNISGERARQVVNHEKYGRQWRKILRGNNESKN